MGENQKEESPLDTHENDPAEVEQAQEIQEPFPVPNNDLEAKVVNPKEELPSDINENDTAEVELAQPPDPDNDHKEEESASSPISETVVSQVNKEFSEEDNDGREEIQKEAVVVDETGKGKEDKVEE